MLSAMLTMVWVVAGKGVSYRHDAGSAGGRAAEEDDGDTSQLV